MQEYTFKKISEAVNCVVDDLHSPGQDRPLWYRGVSCSQYSLLPKLMRGSQRDMSEVFDREARLLARFRERSVPYLSSLHAQDEWGLLFAMQHHGAPTRLLDWTENLFVALFFAANEEASRISEHSATHSGDVCRPTIWVLDPYAWNARVPQLADTGVSILTTADDDVVKWWKPQVSTSERFIPTAKMPVAMYSTYNSARIVAQRGTFTIAGQEWQGLEGYCKPDDVLLTKMVYDGDRRELITHLSQLGFTESMVFPDLVGLSRELERTEGWRT
jgi:hypothetical protein